MSGHGFGGVLVLPADAYKRDRGLWLKARKSGLGASDTANVLGVNPARTALDVWLDKTAPGDPVDDPTEAMTAGHKLEDVVARWTVEKFPWLGKLVPTPGLLAHPEHPWMLATLDRGLADRGSWSHPVRGILEVKTTSDRNYRDKWRDGVPPGHIQLQCQQQMAVTGMDECWVTVGVGGKNGPLHIPEPYRVARSERVIEQLVTYAGAWWTDYVVAGVRPEPTFQDAAKLASLYPADDSLEALQLSDELEARLATYLDAKRRAKEAKEEADRASFDLRKAMGSRTAIADLDGRVVARCSTQVRRTLDKKALAKDRPDVMAVVDEYTRPGTPFHVFRANDEDES
jgi:putative phage-type endonuclease